MSETADTDLANRKLFTRLARIADEIDPVPGFVYELGRSAFEFRRIDAELAELVRDSAVETEALAGVRGGLNVRLLSFEAASLDIDLQVVRQGKRRALLGQISGAVAQLRVETVEGTVLAEVDQLGRFQIADMPAGRLRLQVDTGDAEYVTSWVTI